MTSSATSFLMPVNAITVIRGSSKTFELTVTDQNGKAVDLTGATVYFTVKMKIQDVEWIIQKKSTDPTQVAITNPKGGVAKIFLQPIDTKDRDVMDYVFDVWVVLASGKRFPVVSPSTFEIVAGVTVIQ